MKNLGFIGFWGKNFLGLLLGAFIFNEVSASLIINPTRVIFDGRDRAQAVTIINSSNKTKTYRIKMVEKRQDAKGGYITQKESIEGKVSLNQASPMLRYSPRQVTLGPNERQTVRISLRKSANLPSGEYRSHMAFQILPDAEPVDLNREKAGFKIFMLPSFSIPVQVRNGQVQVSAKILQPKIVKVSDDKFGVAMNLQRQGDFSAFGSLKVLYKPTSQANYSEVGILNNVAVYREARQIPITVNLKQSPKKGFYRVEFLADQSFQQKMFDATEFKID